MAQSADEFTHQILYWTLNGLGERVQLKKIHSSHKCCELLISGRAQ